MLSKLLLAKTPCRTWRQQPVQANHTKNGGIHSSGCVANSFFIMPHQTIIQPYFKLHFAFSALVFFCRLLKEQVASPLTPTPGKYNGKTAWEVLLKVRCAFLTSCNFQKAQTLEEDVKHGQRGLTELNSLCRSQQIATVAKLGLPARIKRDGFILAVGERSRIKEFLPFPAATPSAYSKYVVLSMCLH